MEYKRFDGEPFEDFKRRLYRIMIENYYLTDEEAKTVIDDISERDGAYIASVTFEIKIKS